MFDFIRKLLQPPVPTNTPDVPATFSASDMEHAATAAQRLADVINESLLIARDSENLETRRSSILFARTKLAEAKQLAQQFLFLKLTSLSQVEVDLETLSMQVEHRRFAEIAAGNQEGQQLESLGKIAEAIARYEKLAAEGADTPFTYRRLAILYRKGKQQTEEIRILKLALKHVPQSNSVHYEWFMDRLEKLKRVSNE